MQPSQTTTLLNDVFQNAQMGVDSTQRLIELVEDKPFQSVLIAQRNRYQDVYDRTLQLSDQELKGKKTLQKLSSTMMINLQTIKDKTPSHLAGMMIQGNTMGVIDMTKSSGKPGGGSARSRLGPRPSLHAKRQHRRDETLSVKHTAAKAAAFVFLLLFCSILLPFFCRFLPSPD